MAKAGALLATAPCVTGLLFSLEDGVLDAGLEPASDVTGRGLPVGFGLLKITGLGKSDGIDEEECVTGHGDVGVDEGDIDLIASGFGAIGVEGRPTTGSAAGVSLGGNRLGSFTVMGASAGCAGMCSGILAVLPMVDDEEGGNEV